ncbi:nucleotidyltransferase family protein [Leptolyngbya sp. CCNP1308]|uniref:nucleotidyltransferase family protein n=1 Tax=Leptolyngbya sp. CCNP1308 TaxID=3110255 RepID=UPI002B214958|nr:nucleotidyltransferase family protein [Leptolyngbya sp. CCNP1308]MEA5450203.1 nucleotidyltransferase family protein [Leptolyngbya sp. CCNP1308]
MPPSEMPPTTTLQSIQAILRQHLPEVQQKYRVRQIGVFGSFVRGEQTESSDIDVLVEFDPTARFGLLTFCQLENELSDLLNRKVDLVMKDGLKPRLGERILEEVVYL